MKKNTLGVSVAIIAASLSGCTTTQPKPEFSPAQISEAESRLESCLSRESLRLARNDCLSLSDRLDPLGEERKREAEEHWRSLIDAGGPDYRLMEGVILGNDNIVAKAIDSGADPNMVITVEKAYGPESEDGNITPLAVSLGDLDISISQQLLDAGADPNWRDPDDPNKDVAFDIQLGKSLHLGDASFDAWDSIELLMGRDYHPSGNTLFRWYYEAYMNDWLEDPEIQETYLALRNRAYPEDVQVFEGLIRDEEEKEQQMRAERQRRAAEDAQRRADARARLEAIEANIAAAEQQSTQHMRRIGAKVCQNVSTQISQVTRIGYVERLAESKAQIRVAHAHLRGAPNLTPGGFQPQIIWDRLSNWYLCE